MKFLKNCGHICVVLDMLVLIPIFGTRTTHIPSLDTHEVDEVLWAYLCIVGIGGANTTICH